MSGPSLALGDWLHSISYIFIIFLSCFCVCRLMVERTEAVPGKRTATRVLHQQHIADISFLRLRVCVPMCMQADG
jgi:hypothetical protein